MKFVKFFLMEALGELYNENVSFNTHFSHLSHGILVLNIAYRLQQIECLRGLSAILAAG